MLKKLTLPHPQLIAMSIAFSIDMAGFYRVPTSGIVEFCQDSIFTGESNATHANSVGIVVNSTITKESNPILISKRDIGSN